MTDGEQTADRGRVSRSRKTRPATAGNINADDITFNHNIGNLPADHNKTDTAAQQEIKAAEGLGSALDAAGGDTGTGSSGYTPRQGLSYDEWAQKIRDTMNTDADYQAAKAKLAEAEGNRPDYAGTYDDDLANAYNAILNREGFQYNLDDDALYQQYADKYMAAGKLAMRNSMGQAAALTGGYGSSYGQAVGQQTYDSYLQGLNDVALEMYDRAYGRYQDEGQRLKDAYGLAGDMANTEYGRYMDQMGQWNTDRAFMTDEANNAWNRAYQQDADAYNRAMAEDELAYNRQIDYAQTLAAYGDFSGFADIFGKDRAAEMQKVWNAGNVDLAYNSGKITAEEYKAMTGKYPPGYKAPGRGWGPTKPEEPTLTPQQEAQYGRQYAIDQALKYNQDHPYTPNTPTTPKKDEEYGNGGR